MTIEMRGRLCRVLAASALAGWSGVAFAQATTTFTYDALGRLVTASTMGGPVSGESTTIAYDPAGNRTSHAVAGAPAGLMAPAPPPAEVSGAPEQ
jgi:hypothetical protein